MEVFKGQKNINRICICPKELAEENIFELIEKYKNSHDEKYLNAILSIYEPAINKLCTDIMGKYCINDCLEDLKQCCIIGIMNALENYIPEKSKNFWLFAKPFYIHDEVTNCIREIRSGYSISTNSNDKTFRKIMWLNNQFEDEKFEIKIKLISEETHLSPKTVENYLLSAQRISNLVSLDDLNENYVEKISIENWYTDPLYIILHLETLEDLHMYFRRLDNKEKDIICDTLAFSSRKLEFSESNKPLSFKQIAEKSDCHERTVERNYKKTLKKLRIQLLG